jgi:hypothetical protein
VIFLPRAQLPPKVTIIVRKLDSDEYEIVTEPKLDTTVFGTFLIRLKQCAKGANVKLTGGKIIVSGSLDFNAMVTCLNQGSPIPVELQM